ncbi:MAG: DUF4105 domain-containing protein [Bacteroidales bacterium OttesenSCG-928-I14]|jgi:hypothetical protein|nr:DUF4105 domain-containing protein [Bacteroidales bacterium OttesenSCG-928-I14]
MVRFILLILLISKFITIKATEANNLQISLLTIVPYNNEIYTIYGHSALRIHNSKNNIDIVLSWGTFDFYSTNFLYHFIKGETDYFLSTTDYNQFIQNYYLMNTTVIEQILLLTPKNRESILQILSLNLLPVNRAYCYNFLKNNCTTRIRDIIEKTIGDTLNSSNSSNSNTVRQLINSYSYQYPWVSFGIDLIIGSEGDKPLCKREELFLPMQLKKILGSSIYSSNESIVISSNKILQSNCRKYIHPSFFCLPINVSWLIFCLYGIIISIVTIQIHKNQKSKNLFIVNKIAKICFAILFFLIAIVGSIVIFFVLFSHNPCVHHNWNLFWLHPFHFIGFIGYFFKKSFYWVKSYHWCNSILLLLFLLFKFCIPQNLNSAINPYIYCLILGSLFYLICKKIKM